MPHLFGVHVPIPNILHDWLHPIFANSDVHLKEAFDHNYAMEGGLAALSFGLALGVWALTAAIWKGKDALAHPLDKAPGVRKLLWNKWYVDELYELTLIGPLIWFSREVLWRFVDEVIIDGFVNFVGGACKQVADGLGRLQDGDVGNYATVMLGGLLLVVLCLAGYGLW